MVYFIFVFIFLVTSLFGNVNGTYPPNNYLSINAPNFIAHDINNNVFELYAYPHSIYILRFTSRHCAPCSRLLEPLQELVAHHSIPLITIEVYHAVDIDHIKDYMQSHNVPAPIILDNYKNALAVAYHVRSVPTIFIIQNRKIRYIHIGAYSNILANISDQITFLQNNESNI